MVGDLQRLLEVMRDVDDRHAPGREIADDLEQKLHFSRGERGGGLVHDEDAAVDGERPRDLDDLLLAEAQFFDGSERVDVLLEFLHERAGLALLLGKVDAGRRPRISRPMKMLSRTLRLGARLSS